MSREEIRGRSILEVGAYDINGSLRPWIESFDPGDYVGIDLMEGPGVDLVLSAEKIVEHFGKEKFDVVISTEVLEHARNWRKVISNIKQVCKPHGIILITTRSFGFGYHGSPDGPIFDFWRYELNDMEHIFSDCQIQILETDPQVPGVFLKARKPDPFFEVDLSNYEVYGPIDPIDKKQIIVRNESESEATEMGDEPIFGLIMLASTDETFIRQSLMPFLKSKRIEEIVVMLSEKRYFNGREIEPDRTEDILNELSCPKMKVFKKEYPSDVFTRNAAMRQFKQSNMILVFDPFEIILPQMLEKLMDWVCDNPKQVYEMMCRVYWKDTEHQIKPNWRHLVCVSANMQFDPGTYGEGRLVWNGEPTRVILPESFYYHDLGFALPDKAMLEKSRQLNFNPLWYFNIWEKWAEGMRNIHPRIPDAWPEAVEALPDPDLAKYLAQFGAKKKTIKDKLREKGKADAGTAGKRRGKSGRTAGRRDVESI